MALTKHGHGNVLKEDDDLVKEAKARGDEDAAEVLEALADENDEADK